MTDIDPNVDSSIVVGWDWTLIFCSYIISSLGAATSLQLIKARPTHTGWKSATVGAKNIRLLMHQCLYLFGAAVAEGAVGIWSMHWIGMRSISLYASYGKLEIAYDAGRTVASLITAISFVFLGLMFFAVGDAKTQNHPWWKYVIACALMTGGILTMHYVGMLAVVANAHLIWNDGFIALSGILGLVVVMIALLIYFRFTRYWSHNTIVFILTSLIMGFAVCCVHYVGQIAANYYELDEDPTLTDGYMSSDTLLIIVIVFAVGSSVLLLAFVYIRHRNQRLMERQRWYTSSLVLMVCAIDEDSHQVLCTESDTLPVFPVVLDDDVVASSAASYNFHQAHSEFLRFFALCMNLSSAESRLRQLRTMRESSEITAVQYHIQMRLYETVSAAASMLGVDVSDLSSQFGSSLYYRPTYNVLTLIVPKYRKNEFLFPLRYRFVQTASLNKWLGEFVDRRQVLESASDGSTASLWMSLLSCCIWNSNHNTTAPTHTRLQRAASTVAVGDASALQRRRIDRAEGVSPVEVHDYGASFFTSLERYCSRLAFDVEMLNNDDGIENLKVFLFDAAKRLHRNQVDRSTELLVASWLSTLRSNFVTSIRHLYQLVSASKEVRYSLLPEHLPAMVTCEIIHEMSAPGAADKYGGSSPDDRLVPMAGEPINALQLDALDRIASDARSNNYLGVLYAEARPGRHIQLFVVADGPLCVLPMVKLSSKFSLQRFRAAVTQLREHVNQLSACGALGSINGIGNGASYSGPAMSPTNASTAANSSNTNGTSSRNAFDILDFTPSRLQSFCQSLMSEVVSSGRASPGLHPVATNTPSSNDSPQPASSSKSKTLTIDIASTESNMAVTAAANLLADFRATYRAAASHFENYYVACKTLSQLLGTEKDITLRSYLHTNMDYVSYGSAGDARQQHLKSSSSLHVLTCVIVRSTSAVSEKMPADYSRLKLEMLPLPMFECFHVAQFGDALWLRQALSNAGHPLSQNVPLPIVLPHRASLSGLPISVISPPALSLNRGSSLPPLPMVPASPTPAQSSPIEMNVIVPVPSPSDAEPSDAP